MSEDKKDNNFLLQYLSAGNSTDIEMEDNEELLFEEGLDNIDNKASAQQSEITNKGNITIKVLNYVTDEEEVANEDSNLPDIQNSAESSYAAKNYLQYFQTSDEIEDDEESDLGNTDHITLLQQREETINENNERSDEDFLQYFNAGDLATLTSFLEPKLTLHNATLPLAEGMCIQHQGFNWQTAAFVAAEAVVGVAIGHKVTEKAKLINNLANNIAKLEGDSHINIDVIRNLYNEIRPLLHNNAANQIMGFLNTLRHPTDECYTQVEKVQYFFNNYNIPNGQEGHIDQIGQVTSRNIQNSDALRIYTDNQGHIEGIVTQLLELKPQVENSKNYLKSVTQTVTLTKTALDIFELGANPSYEKGFKLGAEISNLYMLYNGFNKFAFKANICCSFLNIANLFNKGEDIMAIKAFTVTVTNMGFNLYPKYFEKTGELTKLILLNAIDLGIDAFVAFYSRFGSHETQETLETELNAAETYTNERFKGEFGKQVYEKFFKVAIKNKYDVLDGEEPINLVSIESDDYNYDYCIEKQDLTFTCYNADKEIIDLVTIDNQNILLGVENIYSTATIG